MELSASLPPFNNRPFPVAMANEAIWNELRDYESKPEANFENAEEITVMLVTDEYANSFSLDIKCG